jgi:hypothetical protein
MDGEIGRWELTSPQSSVDSMQDFAFEFLGKTELFFESPADFGSGIYTCWNREST